MSIEELKADAMEFARLLDETTRCRVKDKLVQAKSEVEREIVALEMKELQAAKRKAAAESGTQRRYMSELTEYAWDQSERFVKLFVTLDGLQKTHDDNVTVEFRENSINLLIKDVNGKDYTLTINNLLEPIDVENSYRKVKTGMVGIYMKKQCELKHWDHLTTIHKKLKDKQDNELKTDPENPGDALVNIMKRMYNSGDSKTKQMIAKAWTESQDKTRSGRVGNGMDMEM